MHYCIYFLRDNLFYFRSSFTFTISFSFVLHLLFSFILCIPFILSFFLTHPHFSLTDNIIPLIVFLHSFSFSGFTASASLPLLYIPVMFLLPPLVLSHPCDACGWCRARTSRSSCAAPASCWQEARGSWARWSWRSFCAASLTWITSTSSSGPRRATGSTTDSTPSSRTGLVTSYS